VADEEEVAVGVRVGAGLTVAVGLTVAAGLAVAAGLGVAAGLAVGEGAADGAVPWQAARARQVRIRAKMNGMRNRRAMNVEGDERLRKEWLAMGSPP
jgi:hypothetical protein